MRGRGRDRARVINFIFVFLLPQLRVNTVIQSRKVASFVCLFNAWRSLGGRTYSNELQRESLKTKQADRDTLGWCSASIDSPSAITFSVIVWFSLPPTHLCPPLFSFSFPPRFIFCCPVFLLHGTR